MKCSMRFAALLAALILALGLVALPRAGLAAGNDDVEFLEPPGGESGDPDGPTPLFTFSLGMQPTLRFLVARICASSPSVSLRSSPRLSKVSNPTRNQRVRGRSK